MTTRLRSKVRGSLGRTFLGQNVRINGELTGAIEGIPGRLEYIELDLQWGAQGGQKGVRRGSSAPEPYERDRGWRPRSTGRRSS